MSDQARGTAEPTMPVTRTTLERWHRAVVSCATGESFQPLDDLDGVAGEIKSVRESAAKQNV